MAGTAPCPAASATVTVNVVEEPDPGSNGTLTLCSSDVPADLFTSLGGSPDAGGTWTGPTGAAFSGTFTPGTNAPGVYTYTIAVPPPCTSVSATVTVNVVAAPNAGSDGATTLCISSPATALFPSLGGVPQAGGAWTTPGGGAFSGTFTPGTHAPGVYTYTVAGTAPCPAASATVTVNVVVEPDPGGDGFITLCSTDAPMDLFSNLEGSPDQGGVWSKPGGTITSGIFDPTIDEPGVFTYTLSVPPPCSSVSATVTVEVVDAPEAGSDGALSLCITGMGTDLFPSILGSADDNGTWTGPSGAAFSGTFLPGGDTPGAYTYTVPGSAPCPAASATVLVSVVDVPQAGNNGILNLCATGTSADLFPVLGGADAGGTWQGPGGVFGGTFDPATDAPGSYTYTVQGQPPCPAASATVTVNVVVDADAGSDGSLTLCATDASVTLFGLLGGTPQVGGLWLSPAGVAFAGTFDPSAHQPGLYTYVVTVPQPCQNDTAVVNMTVITPPNAGQNATIDLCASAPALDLYSVLNGAPDLGGAWSGPGGAFAGSFDPGTGQPGTYVYTIFGTAPCPNDQASVTVGVEPIPNAGTNGSLTICPEAPSVALFGVLGGNPDTGGSWTAPYGSPSNGVFDPATSQQGAYTYTVHGNITCPDSLANATVNIFLIDEPDAGPNAVTCDLEHTLSATGNWSSGSWSGPAGITFTDPTSPNTTVQSAQGGSYVLTWSTISDDGCGSGDSVTITFTDAIVPLVSTTNAICNGSCNGGATVSATGGNTDAAGHTFVWSAGTPVGQGAQVTGLCAGAFTVTVLDMNGCSETATFVIEEPPPHAIQTIEATPETSPGSCDGSLVGGSAGSTRYSVNGGAGYQASATFTGLCPGTYTVVVQDASGCLASGSATVASPAPVVAGFSWSPDPIYVNNPLVSFQNTSTINAQTFLWDFGGTGSSTATSPVHAFPGVLGADYMVCLTAFDANGCPDTYCVRVEVLDLLTVWVPNAFTPNADGINEVFRPVFNLPEVVDYEFMIFDRWGEQIFTSIDPGQGWDGRVRSATAQTEVYVWKLIYRDPLNVERKELVGHVTLLK